MFWMALVSDLSILGPQVTPGHRAVLKGCWTHNGLEQKSVFCVKSLKLCTGYCLGSSASPDLTNRSACCCRLHQTSHPFHHPFSSCPCPVPTALCSNFYLPTLRLAAVRCSLCVSQDLFSCAEDINLGRLKSRKRKFPASR